jgi:hypothetical protein
MKNSSETKDSTKRMRRNSVVLILIIFALSIIAWFVSTSLLSSETGEIAILKYGDGNIERVSLKTNREFEIKTNLGTNHLHIENGEISIEDASCKNKECIKQGAISHPGQTIVCVPNKLIMSIEGQAEFDGVSG